MPPDPGPPAGGPSPNPPSGSDAGAATAALVPSARSPVPSAPAAVGEPAPDFTLTDQHGQTVALAGFRGERAVLLVFYPYAFSRVCGSELQAIHDSVEDFQNERVQVLAASCDALYSLRAYADEAGFGFPLLADHWPHGAAARAYGVFDEQRGCAVRGTFLIDRAGVVRWTVVNGLADARSLDDYRAALAAAGV
ncbi:MAG: peroxiredoxin [Catenulisporales bacterium]|jgi:peroxiredoxin|nr:peroxiredoxin [Catenulisporales bacterium]